LALVTREGIISFIFEGRIYVPKLVFMDASEHVSEDMTRLEVTDSHLEWAKLAKGIFMEGKVCSESADELPKKVSRLIYTSDSTSVLFQKFKIVEKKFSILSIGNLETKGYVQIEREKMMVFCDSKSEKNIVRENIRRLLTRQLPPEIVLERKAEDLLTTEMDFICLGEKVIGYFHGQQVVVSIESDSFLHRENNLLLSKKSALRFEKQMPFSSIESSERLDNHIVIAKDFSRHFGNGIAWLDHGNKIIHYANMHLQRGHLMHLNSAGDLTIAFVDGKLEHVMFDRWHDPWLQDFFSRVEFGSKPREIQNNFWQFSCCKKEKYFADFWMGRRLFREPLIYRNSGGEWEGVTTHRGKVIFRNPSFDHSICLVKKTQMAELLKPYLHHGLENIILGFLCDQYVDDLNGDSLKYFQKLMDDL
jgi:hypothetical protein